MSTARQDAIQLIDDLFDEIEQDYAAEGFTASESCHNWDDLIARRDALVAREDF